MGGAWGDGDRSNVSDHFREPISTGKATSEIYRLLRLFLVPRRNRPEIGIRLQFVTHPANKVVGRTGLILLGRTATVLVLYLNHVLHLERAFGEDWFRCQLHHLDASP